jgi:23S rRNA G2069 N7-methylase RlmK/C1962 C5-methylase RlmI
MKSRRFTPQRYQLKKTAVPIVRSGHPWIFRTHLSSAATVFRTGQWLSLVDSANHVQGYGIYEAEGLIGIRVLKQGGPAPDKAWLEAQWRRALAKRRNVREYTDAIRALHGENDGLPGVVVDVYGDTAVLQTYSPAVDSLGRYLGEAIRAELGLKNLIWKLPVKRKHARAGEVRVLAGKLPGAFAIREGKMQLTVEVGAGQKSGAFLDLRGLRKWVSLQKLAGQRVLNLFSYTGTLALAAEVAGAAEIWSVDISPGATEAARKYHALNPRKHRWIAADVFEWFPQVPPSEKFDLIVIDPPMMASQVSQVPVALRAYRKLYRTALDHLTPRGRVVACCCTSRIPRKVFQTEVAQVLGERLALKRVIQPEEDHPVGFPEGDYLKLLVFEPK